MVELTDIEHTGIKVIALIRNGNLDAFKCSTCKLQDTRNCDGAIGFKNAIYSHPLVGEFYACPLIMIPNSIHEWLDEYDYYEKYPSSAPLFDDVNPRYWATTRLYNQFNYELTSTKDNKDSSPSDNKSKLKSLMLNKG